MERVSCIFMINGAFNFCSAPGHQKVRAGPGLTAGASSIGLRDPSLSPGSHGGGGQIRAPAAPSRRLTPRGWLGMERAGCSAPSAGL